jgi:hypothetical protein
MYDRQCTDCGLIVEDCFEAIQTENPPCTADACQGTLVRAWIGGHGSKVISDECDVWVKHGICNLDGTPKHYRFKSEMRAEAKRRGVQPHVQHVGTPGGDRSQHTSRWI